MTTIAYRDGILAGDRQVSGSGSVASGRLRKVRKTSEGDLYAATGSLVPIKQFFDWVEYVATLAPGELMPRLPEGKYTGIIVSYNGIVTEYEDGAELPSWGKLKFDAWGSGRDVALGALHAGASAVEAVKIASKVCCYTGGGVSSVKL